MRHPGGSHHLNKRLMRARRIDFFLLVGVPHSWKSGCELGFAAACRNLAALDAGEGDFASAPPGLDDYPIILRGSKGEIRERDASALNALACREGWRGACR